MTRAKRNFLIYFCIVIVALGLLWLLWQYHEIKIEDCYELSGLVESQGSIGIRSTHRPVLNIFDPAELILVVPAKYDFRSTVGKFITYYVAEEDYNKYINRRGNEKIQIFPLQIKCDGKILMSIEESNYDLFWTNYGCKIGLTGVFLIAFPIIMLLAYKKGFLWQETSKKETKRKADEGEIKPY